MRRIASPRIAGSHAAAAALCSLLALAGVGGCATSRGGIEEPEVSLSRLDPEDVGVFEQELDVGLRIRNPNAFPLEARGIRFDIELNGERVASGADDTRFTVPAGGEHVVGAKAHAQSIAMVRQLARGDLEYEIDGVILLDNEEAGEVGFQHESRLLD